MITDLHQPVSTPNPPPESYPDIARGQLMSGTNVPPPPDDPNDNMPTYGVDFETYYDKECTIQGLLGYAYCRHPLFEAYMVSIYGPGVSYVGHPAYAPWDRIKGPGKRWISHNAAFDEEVQLFLVETGVVAKDALPEEWHCTADLAAYLGAPRSLAGSLKWLHNKEISKETRNKMKGKRWSEMTPEFQIEVLAYAMDDSVFARDELWVKFHKEWPAHERAVSVLTRKMGRRGLKVNLPLLDEGILKLDAVKSEARKLIPWAPEEIDGDKGVLAPTQLKKLCQEHGIEPPASLAKDSAECEEWEDKYGGQFPWVGAMRDFRRSNILVKKLRKMRSRVKPDGRMTYALKYFGASITGRWSGDGGWNGQNQNKEAVFGVDARMLLIPEDGHDFLIADSSQIEPRVLNWLAGNWPFLQKIREGFGLYEAFAVAKGKWPAEKKGLLKKEASEGGDPSIYAWAKASVLGLGFGCGPSKFVEVARIMAGLVITEEESKALVADFRSTETHIAGDKGIWTRLQSAMGCHIGRDFHMRLPSGRLLRYRKVECEDGGLSAEVVKQIHGAEKVIRMRYWGGLLTENITQASAREVLCSILLRLDAAGIYVCLHVHDEVVCEVPTGASDEERAAQRAQVEAIMSATPGFIKGCPLGCEIRRERHYCK